MNNIYSSAFLKEVVSDAYAFFWEVYDGRPVIREKPVGRLFSVRGQETGELDRKVPLIVLRGSKKRYYPPLRRNPVLHRTFCEIAEDRDILKFVSKYGLLGFTFYREVRRRDGVRGDMLFVESVARWRQELAEMRRFVHLWELVRNGRLSLLSALVSREDDGIFIITGGRKNLVADSGSQLARKWDVEGEQSLEAARQFLTGYINGKLMGKVFPRVLPLYKKRVYLSPGDLLSAMWLMFLWEVVGEVRPYRCPGCGEWFDPRRSTRKTCGDRCRKKMSRSKMKDREKQIE